MDAGELYLAGVDRKLDLLKTDVHLAKAKAEFIALMRRDIKINREIIYGLRQRIKNVKSPEGQHEIAIFEQQIVTTQRNIQYCYGAIAHVRNRGVKQ